MGNYFLEGASTSLCTLVQTGNWVQRRSRSISPSGIRSSVVCVAVMRAWTLSWDFIAYRNYQVVYLARRHMQPEPLSNPSRTTMKASAARCTAAIRAYERSTTYDGALEAPARLWLLFSNARVRIR